MRIREATPDDEPAVIEELLRPSYRAAERRAPEFNELDGDAVAAADCGRWLDHDDRALLVAERDGALAGFVSGLVVDPPPIYARGPEFHVDGLYVKPAHRRRGVASALVDRIAVRAEAEGCAYLGVTVHAANDAARRFYDERFDLTFRGYRAHLG